MAGDSLLCVGFQRFRRARPAALAVLLAVAGCSGASVKGSRDFDIRGAEKPTQIIVYEFAYAPEQEPGVESARQLTPEEESIGRQVSTIVADSIIVTLEKKTDISTVQPSDAGLPPDGTMVIEGEFVSIDEGSAAGRMLVGFGAGRSKLETRARAFYIFNGEKRPFSEYTLEADSGAMPGMALGVGMGAATGEWAREMAVAAGGVALETALGNDTIADAQRTGEELAIELIRQLKKRGWVEDEK